MRSPLLALALAATVLTACSDDSPDLSVDDPVVVPSSVPAQPSPTGSVLTTAPTADAATPVPSDTRGPAPAAGAPAPAASSAPPVAAGAPAPAAASRATRAGRYTYDASGTVTLGAGAPQSRSGTATLTVDPPEGDRQSSVLEGQQGRTETDVVLRADGRYLARLLLTTPAFSKEFRPASPVLLLPSPADVGRSWSFTLKSTDGKTTATAKNRIVRSEPVTVGGTRVDTRVVETVLTLRGDVVYDGTTTTNVAPDARLPVRERGSGKGTVSGVAFQTRTTSTLRSLEPA